MSRPLPQARPDARRRWAGLVLPLLLGAAPVQAATQVDVETLAKAVRETGTEIVESDRCEEGLKGYYEFEKDRIDRLTLCTNNIDVNDSDDVWEVLAHETTHIIQACDQTGEGQAFNDAYFPRIYRELQQLNPSSVGDTALYGSWSKRQEIEARYMELLPPEDVIDFFYKSQCFKQD